MAAIHVSVAALVARLSGRGVAALDAAHRCVYADPRACALLGAASALEACAKWEMLRVALGIDRPSQFTAQSSPLRRRIDVDHAGERRSLRIELHPLNDGAVALLGDAQHLDDLDRLFILAGEAQARRHALSGLAHRAKGPLNNFHLTLALLEATLARADASAFDALLARWRRHVDVLQTETQRLTECVEEIAAHGLRRFVERDDVDANAIASDALRVLRHEATLNDVDLAFDEAEGALRIAVDAHEFELALLGFVTTVLATTDAGGTLRISTACAEASAHISITGSPATMPVALPTAVFGTSPADAASYCAAVAGRLIVEANDGNVALVSPASGWGFEVKVPIARV